MSTENIITRLQQLDCSELSFSKLVAGIISRTNLVKAFNNKFTLSGSVADRLLEFVTDMESLAASVQPIPVDWSRTTDVGNALLLRLTAKAAHDLGLTEPQLDIASDWATQKVREN